MTPQDLLSFRLEEVPRLLHRVIDAQFEKLGLSTTQWRLLAYVFRDEGLTQTELASCLELERATVGQVIDKMETRNLVARERSADDRRVWRIVPTRKARDMMPRMRELADRIHNQTFAGIQQSEFRQLEDLLARIAHNLTS
jgi:DNA-binding MarR family transcriptional regulator